MSTPLHTAIDNAIAADPTRDDWSTAEAILEAAGACPGCSDADDWHLIVGMIVAKVGVYHWNDIISILATQVRERRS
jgi:hypothetical protein